MAETMHNIMQSVWGSFFVFLTFCIIIGIIMYFIVGYYENQTEKRMGLGKYFIYGDINLGENMAETVEERRKKFYEETFSDSRRYELNNSSNNIQFVYPDVRVQENGTGIGMLTHVRIKRKGKWYLVPLVISYQMNAKDDVCEIYKKLFIELMKKVYSIQLFYVLVDKEKLIMDKKVTDKIVFEILDTNQNSEEDRYNSIYTY